jgi:hypothetical protein
MNIKYILNSDQNKIKYGLRFDLKDEYKSSAV